jgi:mitogen-activated protein kinase kinase kinase
MCVSLLFWFLHSAKYWIDCILGPRSFKWVRGEAIGRGRAYLGLNVTTGEMIAVKQYRIPHNADELPGRPSARTIKREMENMKALSHPNLVEYLGLEEGDEFLSLYVVRF